MHSEKVADAYSVALRACFAGPGVLFGAAFLAVLVYYTFPYNWTWVECLLFGAIFSATDPVAVVAVLKEVLPAWISRPCSSVGISPRVVWLPD